MNPTLAAALEARKALEDTLREWFPADAFVKAGSLGPWPMFPEEAVLVERAVERRRLEFATGRHLTRLGLRHWGLEEAPIGTGKLREPLWPPGIRGALSHDGDTCIVVLLREPREEVYGALETPEPEKPKAPGLGVDLMTLPQPPGRMEPLRSMFLARNDEDAEVHRAFGHETGADVSASLLLFSLKEAIVKAISADVGAFLELQDLQVFPEKQGGGKVVYRGRVFRGSLWARSSGPYLVTAAFLSEALKD